MIKEEWKTYTVEGTAKEYLISNLAMVKSKNHKGEWHEHSTYKNNGYRCIPYKKANGKNGLLYLHKIMGSLFVPNPHDYKKLKFKNGDSGNCQAHNLEWISPEEAKKMNQAQIKPFDIYENYAPNSKLAPAKVALIKKRALENEKTGKTSWRHMAKQFGITPKHLASIRREEIWKNVKPLK